jgi:hypothetical protein
MAFHRPGRPRQRQPGVHSVAIGSNPADEADKRCQSAAGSVLEPSIKLTYAAASDQATEALQEVIAARDPLIGGERLPERLPLVFVELFGADAGTASARCSA